MHAFVQCRWAGRVEVIKRVIFVWKSCDFIDFVKVGPVQWWLEIARAGFQSQSGYKETYDRVIEWDCQNLRTPTPTPKDRRPWCTVPRVASQKFSLATSSATLAPMRTAHPMPRFLRIVVEISCNRPSLTSRPWTKHDPQQSSGSRTFPPDFFPPPDAPPEGKCKYRCWNRSWNDKTIFFQ